MYFYKSYSGEFRFCWIKTQYIMKSHFIAKVPNVAFLQGAFLFTMELSHQHLKPELYPESCAEYRAALQAHDTSQHGTWHIVSL